MARARAWLGGAVGGFAVWRLLRRKAAQPRVETPDPAEELRTKLAESRSVADDRDEFESGETPVDEADPDARRRSVHEQARATLDELSGPGER